jgi:hypothetical protein
MATELRLRRGTTAEHENFTGAEAEVTVDTDKNTVVVHDGAAEGGYALLKDSDVRVDTLADLQALDTANARSVQMLGRSDFGDGGEGHFYWQSGDFSTEVANDEVAPGEGDGGIYVAPASDKTGAIGAWVRASVREIDARWYGLSESRSDNGPNIQKAVEAASRIGFGGGTVIIPSGVFDVRTPIDYRSESIKSVVLKGLGSREGTTLNCTDSINMFILGGSNVDCFFYQIKFRTSNPTFDQNMNCFFFDPSNGSTQKNDFSRCFFDGFTVAINNQCSGNTSIEDCYFVRSWFSSIRFGGGQDSNSNSVSASENYVRRCRISANSSGAQNGSQIDIQSNAALRMWRCDVTGGSLNLKVQENIPGDIPANVWCSDVIFGGLTESGPCVQLSTGTQNANFRDCVIEASSAEGVAVANGAQYVDFDGGMCRHNDRNGFLLDGMNGTVSIKNMRISGNDRSDSGTADEILVSNVDSGENVIISDCHIGSKFTPNSSKARYGINFNANHSGTSFIKNCVIGGYTNNAIQISGAASGTVTENDNNDLGS